MYRVTIHATSRLDKRFSSSNTVNGFLFLITTFYTIMMFASSYVEEEQQFWYWIMAGWTTLLFLKGNHK